MTRRHVVQFFRGVSAALAPTILGAATLMGGSAHAAQIPLANPTVTFQQGAPYQIPASINGTAYDGVGWGVFGGQNSPQAAVFQTTAPVNAAELQFTLPQFLGGAHSFNQYRLSVTSVANPSTANPASDWTVLTPSEVNSGIEMLQDVGSGYFRRTNKQATSLDTIVAATPYNGITGFKLEAVVPAGGSSIGGASNGNLVLSEFFVSDAPNLALIRPASASGATWNGFPASNITDGNRTSISHPAAPTPEFAYMIDLGRPVEIDQIDIYNRADGCCTNRLNNYQVSIHDDNGGVIGAAVWSAVVRTNTDSGVGGVDSLQAALDAAGSFVGQWVKIQRLAGAPADYAPQIAEVEVNGAYLHDFAKGAPVNVVGGVMYPGQFASSFTDGDLNTFAHPDSPGGGAVSFLIDLGQNVDINSIDIHNRNDGCPCTDRLTNYTVEVLSSGGTTVWSGFVRANGTNSGNGGVDTLVAAFDPGGVFQGQYVRITGPGNVAYSPQLAEVEVFGWAAPVPEPATWVLGGLGALGLVGVRVRRRR